MPQVGAKQKVFVRPLTFRGLGLPCPKRSKAKTSRGRGVGGVTLPPIHSRNLTLGDFWLGPFPFERDHFPNVKVLAVDWWGGGNFERSCSKAAGKHVPHWRSRIGANEPRRKPYISTLGMVAKNFVFCRPPVNMNRTKNKKTKNMPRTAKPSMSIFLGFKEANPRKERHADSTSS